MWNGGASASTTCSGVSRPRCKTYRDTRLVGIARHRERLHAFGERAQRAIENLLDNRDLRIERAGQLLTALSYRGVLERGFALVRGLDGSPLRRAAAVEAGQGLDIEFADGRVRAAAEGAPSLAPVVAPRPRRRRRGRQRRRPGQPVLSVKPPRTLLTSCARFSTIV